MINVEELGEFHYFSGQSFGYLRWGVSDKGRGFYPQCTTMAGFNVKFSVLKEVLMEKKAKEPNFDVCLDSVFTAPLFI